MSKFTRHGWTLPFTAAVAVIMLLLAVAAQADWYPRRPPRPIEQPWKSGATTVTLSPDGTTLRVSGVGAMEDYDYDIFDHGFEFAKDLSDFVSRNTPPEWYRADWYGNDTIGAGTITNLIIEDGVTYIGDMAFAYLHGLTSVTIPNSVTDIGRSAFFRCTRMTSATLPDSMTVIRDNLFNGCYSLTTVNISNGVTEIESAAFSACVMTSITIPNSVTVIREEAFYGCVNLTSVTIPNGVTTIGEKAFSDCRNLTSVTIPESVTELGRFAFADCPNLTSIIVRTPNPPDIGHHPYSYSMLGILRSARSYDKFIRDTNSNVFNCINWSNACLYVPANSIRTYRDTEMWNKFDCITSIESIESDEISVTALAVCIIAAGLILSAVRFVVIRKLRKSSRKGVV